MVNLPSLWVMMKSLGVPESPAMNSTTSSAVGASSLLWCSPFGTLSAAIISALCGNLTFAAAVLKLLMLVMLVQKFCSFQHSLELDARDELLENEIQV